MAKIFESTTLDDAYSSLHDAAGLPDTSGGRNKAQFFLRVAVIFGWLSVESSAKFFMREWVSDGFVEPGNLNLSNKLCLLKALRRIRSEAVVSLTAGSYTKQEYDRAVRTALSDQEKIARAYEDEKEMFDMPTFKAERLLRSDITHNNTGKEPTVQEVRACLDYCTSLIVFAGGMSVRKETSYTASVIRN